MAAPFLDFTRTCDAAAATTRKLEKQSVLAAYLDQLDDTDLSFAIPYFVGRPFPATDDRNLTLGGATVSNLLLDLLRLDPDTYYRNVVQSGEIGEAVSRLWPAGGPAPEDHGILSRHHAHQPLTLHDLSSAFENIASTGVVEH